MAAELKFYAGSALATDITGSGLGFFGAGGFGTSVQVGQYQDTSFITNGAGSENGGTSTNAKYLGNTSGVSINSATADILANLALASGSLKTSFTFDSAVKTQNCKLRIYDRVSKDNDPSGVTCQVAQLCNGGSGVNQTTGAAQAGHNGWLALHGSGLIMTLLSGPGESGLSPSGTLTEDDRHDWYVCLSSSPTSIGSKSAFGCWVELEYL